MLFLRCNRSPTRSDFVQAGGEGAPTGGAVEAEHGQVQLLPSPANPKAPWGMQPLNLKWLARESSLVLPVLGLPRCGAMCSRFDSVHAPSFDLVLQGI